MHNSITPQEFPGEDKDATGLVAYEGKGGRR